MRIPLSTHPLTLFYKCVIVLYGPMMLMGVMLAFLEREYGVGLIAAITAVALIVSWWTDWRPLKHVIAGEHGIEVSNYRRNITIPYRQIAAVHQYGTYYRCIDITLKEPCPFGEHIVFLPYTSFAGLFKRRSPALGILLDRIKMTYKE